MSQRNWGAAAEDSTGSAPIAYLPWVQPEGDVEAQPSATEVPELDESHVPVFELVEHELDQADRADALVLRKLARHGMSQREVEVELARELDTPQILAAVSRYVRLGYIDDERLAETIVRSQRDRKHKGIAGVRRELDARGIPADVSSRVLATLSDDDELERAIEIAGQRLRRVASEPREVQQRRVVSFLSRRGYSPGVSARAFSLASAEHISD